MDMRVAELRAAGLDEREARDEALRRFGDLSDAREYCRMMDTSMLRNERRRDWLADLWHDLRWTLRQMRRTPAFTLLAVVTFGTGIGAATAIWSVVDRLLVNPMPVPGGDRIVSLVRRAPKSGLSITPSADLIRAWRTGVTAFEHVAAISPRGPAGNSESRLGTGPDELKLEAGAFEPSVPRLLGLRPALGRWFTDDEAAPGAPSVAILGYGLWKRRFGGDRDVIGHVIRLDGSPRTIVGVAARDFELPFFAGPPEGKEIWTPLVVDTTRGGLNAMAWLRPGATAAAAEQEMTTVMRSDTRDPFNGTLEGMVVRPRDALGSTTRDLVMVTFGAVAVLLLIACANVANLLLARAVGRRRELAIRTAVGAGRQRLVRQLITESALLALTGGVLGLFIAWGGLHLIVSLRPDNLATLDRVRLAPAVLFGSLGASLLTGVVFGLAPALVATERGIGEALRSSAGGSGHRRSTRVRSGLVILEIALSVVLLVGAGLLVRSFRALQQVRLGVDPRGLISVSVSFPKGRYASGDARRAEIDAIGARLRRVGGVRAMTVAYGLPGAPGVAFGALQIEGRPIEGDTVRAVSWNAVEPDFFRAVGLRIREGTTLTNDTTLRQVVINESMAARYWPGASAVGRRLRLADGGDWSAVVGVVDDVRLPGGRGAIEEHQLYGLYTPIDNGATFVLRVADDIPQLTRRLTSAIETGDDVTVYGMRSMTDLVARRFVRPRFALALLGTFAGIALLVSTVGLYGIVAYAVTCRTREMGIRLALGARPGSVTRLVVGEGARLGLAGVAIGLAAAAATAGVMRSLVFGIAPLDLATFAAVGSLLGAVTLVASYVPARRATRVDPLVAVRSD